MNSSSFRAEARKVLSGKWGKAALITLAYGFISLAISFALNLISEQLASLGDLVLEIPLSFGLIKAYLKLYNGEDVGAFDFLSLGFSAFGRAWGIAFNMLGKLLVPFILMIVSIILLVVGSAGAVVSSYSQSSASSSLTGGFSALGIIALLLFLASTIWYTVKSYYYQLAYIIAAEDEKISAKDSVNKSRELMDGKRGKLFVLQLSFIGWSILAAFTFYIGYLWLVPYIEFAIIAFYKFTLGNTAKVEVEQPVEVEENKQIEE